MQRSANDTPKATNPHDQFSVKEELISSTTQFLIRRVQMWPIVNEDPHGIVHIVQPVGSYFQDRSMVRHISHTTKFLILEEQICSIVIKNIVGQYTKYSPRYFVQDRTKMPYKIENYRRGLMSSLTGLIKFSGERMISSSSLVRMPCSRTRS